MFGRSLYYRLDLLKTYDQSTGASELSDCMILFKAREPVWAQNFGCSHKWIKGTVLSPIGNVMFKVHTAWSTWSRHKDKLHNWVDDCEVVGGNSIINCSSLRVCRHSIKIL